MTRWLGLALLASFTVAVMLARFPHAAGAGPGIIDVTVVNNSARSSPVAQQVIILHERAGQITLPTRQLTTDSAGTARFVDLDTATTAAYAVTTDFGDVTYESDSLTFDGASTMVHLTLKVWETTNVDPGLKVVAGLLVLTKPDSSTQSIGALELLTVDNPSDKTFVPSASGPSGPMGLLRFSLPPGSSAVQTEAGLDPARIIQISAGFASASPLLPGKHQIGFAYRFPYQGSTYTFTKSVILPTDDFRVLAPPDGFTVASSQLASAGIANVGQQKYSVWTGKSLIPGTKVSIQLDGLPQRTPWDRVVTAFPRDGLPPIAILPVAVLGAAIPIVYASRRTTARASREHMVSPANLVIGQIVALDDRHDAGLLSDADHAVERAALVAQAARRYRDLGSRR